MLQSKTCLLYLCCLFVYLLVYLFVYLFTLDRNRQDLNLQPKNSTQLEVRMLREFGMVGRKTFRCLLFSFSDIAKMVRKVDVPIPNCIQRVMDGEVRC